jgi:hypothetical protein
MVPAGPALVRRKLWQNSWRWASSLTLFTRTRAESQVNAAHVGKHFSKPNGNKLELRSVATLAAHCRWKPISKGKIHQ